MNNRNWVLCIVVIVALFPARASLAQQSSATIKGTVIAASRQPASDAVVLLLDQLGASVATTRTDRDGRFHLDQVSPGTYTLLAEATGQRSEGRVLVVQAALPITIDLTLAARAAESVVVQGAAEAPSVTTRMTIAGEALRRLPAALPSRGLQQALATLPGWAGEDNGVLHVRGVDDGFLYVEDGVPVYDRMDTLFGIAPDPASIGSVNVLTGYIPAEYGLKSGAVIEVQSSTTPQSRWLGSVDAGIGSDAIRSLRALGGGPIGSRATAGLSIASERSDRFLDPVHPDNLHNQGGVLSGEGHINLLPSTRDLLKMGVTGGRSRYQVPHGEIQENAGQNQRQRLVQNSQSLSWQRTWSDAVVSQVAGYRRHVDAHLRDSPADTPIAARSDRENERLGVLASATVQRGRHTTKVGLEAARLALSEDFTFAVTDAAEAEEADINEAAAAFTLANPFRFSEATARRQFAFYAQDRFYLSDRFTVDFGVRFDRTHLLVSASQLSPRLGAAYSWPTTRTTLRASVNRFFQPPQPEHLLLASSAAARGLSPFADDNDADAGGSKLEPERQTAWEVGIEQWLGGIARFDAAVWDRHVRNYADPNVFFGTTIIFPNSVAKGTARGMDVRLELARYRGWSSFVSYTLSKVEQVGPINGGLFLEENIVDIGPGTHFIPDHDRRHVAAGGVTYQDAARGFSASLAGRYQSGTPLEIEDADVRELIDRPGADLVDFQRGRVLPHTAFDVAVAQTLRQTRSTELSVRFAVLNLTDRAYALNFGNPFSGTHFGTPRTLRLDLRVGLR
jgi:outer membrane receptor protein involved in Fe transport